MLELIDAVLKLTPAEKLQLVEVLWDDLAAHPESLPVPDWQLAELDRRKQTHLADPSSALNWEELKRRIREREIFCLTLPSLT